MCVFFNCVSPDCTRAQLERAESDLAQKTAKLDELSTMCDQQATEVSPPPTIESIIAITAIL